MSQDYYKIRGLDSKGFPTETRYYRDGRVRSLSAERTNISDYPGLLAHSIISDDGQAFIDPDDKNESESYAFGKWVNRNLTPPEGNMLSRVLSSTGRLGGASLGGLTGLGVGALVDKLTGSRRGKLLGSLAGGALGYMLGAAAKDRNSYASSSGWGNVRPNVDAATKTIQPRIEVPIKSASFFGDPKQAVLSALFSDYRMNPADKTRAISIIQGMPSSQLAPLARALRAAVGASAGAIVMKFLLGAGKWGTIFGAIGGGLLGGLSSGPRRTSGLFDNKARYY